jgi:outer membrane lipoprotein SlyB
VVELFLEKNMNVGFHQKSLVFLCAAILLGTLGSAAAQAQVWSSNPQASSPQEAKARYEADKKLCADDASADARLQCRRDAQAVYDKALAANKASNVYSSQSAQTGCTDCGQVTKVHVTEKKGESNAVGMIAGGVAGAVLGHQLGGGLGKDMATVAGAAGGAYAGKKVQENMNAHKIWTVSVQYPDGRTGSYTFSHDPGFEVGTKVRLSGQTVVRN